jgi:hypothetical protein
MPWRGDGRSGSRKWLSRLRPPPLYQLITIRFDISELTLQLHLFRTLGRLPVIFCRFFNPIFEIQFQ